ncbi:hypothetical protein WA158_001313 [Blastocystis sp. Blastoise]
MVNIYVWSGVACAGVAILMSLYKMGVFMTPKTIVGEIDEVYIVAMNFQGPFKDYMKADKYYQENYLKNFKVAPKVWTSGGLYYNPPLADQSKNVWGLYWVLDQEEYDAINTDGTPFKKFVLPKSRILESNFPFTNSLSGMLGAMKVYPVLNKYMTENKIEGYGCIEMYYSDPAKPMRYIYYLDKTDLFPQIKESMKPIDVSTL